jgi:PEP-CTERM motif
MDIRAALSNRLAALTAAACVAVALVPAASPAEAALITFKFEGLVVGTDYQDGFALFPGASAGSPFSGFFVFDSTTPDTNPDPNIGNYQQTVGAFAFSLAGKTIAFDTAGVVGIPIDPRSTYPILVEPRRYDIAGGTIVDVAGETSSITVGVELLAFEDVLTTDALPLTPPNLADFTITSAAFNFSSLDTTTNVRGGLTSFTLAAGAPGSERPEQVPEPATIALLGIGLGCVALLRRWRGRIGVK